MPAFNVRFKRRRNISLPSANTVAQEGFKFRSDQPWIDTNKTSMSVPTTVLRYRYALEGVLTRCGAVNFVNETPASISGAKVEAEDDVPPIPSASRRPEKAKCETAAVQVNGSYHSSPQSEATETALPPQRIHRGGSATISIPDLLCHPSAADSPSPYSVQSQSSSQISGSRPGKLYTDPSESALTDHHFVELLHHFKNVVGRVWVGILPFSGQGQAADTASSISRILLRARQFA